MGKKKTVEVKAQPERSSGRWLLIGIVVLVAVAILVPDDDEPEVEEVLPTVMVLPTAVDVAAAVPTGTDTEVPTVEASATDAPTNTPMDTVTITETATVTPSLTITPSATITDTPVPTATLAPSPTNTRVHVPERTMYTVNETRVRAAPDTESDIVTNLLPGERVSAFDTVQGEFVLGSSEWIRVEILGREAFIHASLLSNSPPVVSAPVQPATGGGGNTGSGGGGGFSSVPGASPLCAQRGFDFSVCPSYAPEPANCDAVVARGIPADVAACCFPDRDRDNDGVACYGD